MKKSSIFILFLLSVYFAQSQDISGEWTGTLYQEAGGVRYEYSFEMNLQQVGNKITGTSEIRFLDNKNVYGKMKLSGKLIKKSFIFEESEILKENFDGQTMSWCIKRGTLYYSQGSEMAVLQGDWTGTIGRGTCSPGTITLQRKINQNKLGKSGKKLKEAARGNN